jgi:predicted GNAT family acetyltransferase
VQAFSQGHQDEVLAFLAQRAIHTVFMAGLIRDNGLISSANRGTFYGCRDRHERLTAVALIGSKTIIEAHDHTAFEALAGLIPDNLNSHLVRGEQRQMEYIIGKYAAAGRAPRQFIHEVLLEQSSTDMGVPGEPRLRLAYAEDLESVININAALGFEESGLNPLVQDGPGMWARTARRVDQGRVWILIDKKELIFKADIISETPEAVFIEGVYVRPEARRKGHGLRCMTQLARNLLGRCGSICLVVNEENKRAQAFYQRVGYEARSAYSTAYFSAV